MHFIAISIAQKQIKRKFSAIWHQKWVMDSSNFHLDSTWPRIIGDVVLPIHICNFVIFPKDYISTTFANLPKILFLKIRHLKLFYNLNNTRKLGHVPLHTSTQIQFQWNGTCAITPYINCNEREHENVIFFTT